MPTSAVRSTSQGEEGSDYLEAVRRKIQLARYHLDSLKSQFHEENHNLVGDLPISMQAPFEGVLYSFVAASDQTAEAINLIYKLGLVNAGLQDALEKMPKSDLRSHLFKWQQRPIAADVRDIRRRAAHHHYTKTPQGPQVSVQLPTGAKPYPSKRTLDEYAEAAVLHLEQLNPLIDKLDQIARDRLENVTEKDKPASQVACGP